MLAAVAPVKRSSPSSIHAHLERFLDDLSSNRFLVACSGGPDSVALARALHEVAGKRSIKFEIAHVNHKLRGAASQADQRFVEKLARSLGLRVHVLSRPVSGSEGNI